MSIYLNNGDKASTIHEADGAYGTYYLATNPKTFEIQRSNNFMFYVPFPEDFFSQDADFQALNNQAFANASQFLMLSVDQSFVPHFKNDTIQLKRGNNTMKFAGVPTFESGTAEFTDFIGAGTKDILMAWQRKVYDVKTEKVGLASDYKTTAYLVEKTPDYQTVRTWVLEGCWISSLSEDPYNHESNDKHGISCTFEYDKAYIDTRSI